MNVEDANFCGQAENPSRALQQTMHSRPVASGESHDYMKIPTAAIVGLKKS